MVDPNDPKAQAIEAVQQAGRTAIQVASAVGTGLAAAATALAEWLQANVLTPENLQWTRELLWDVTRSILGVIRLSRPSVAGALSVFSEEIVGNVVGWTAGLTGAAMVGSFFQTRGIQNLWGLAGRKDKMLVSRETYEWMSTFISFFVGLMVLIVVRYFVRSTVGEFNRLRQARLQAELSESESGS